MMLASTALGRIDQVMCAPTLKKPPRPQKPQDSRVEFADVSFTYDAVSYTHLDVYKRQGAGSRFSCR